jgi:hypothetical protein
MSLMTLGIAYVIVLLAGLVLMAELRTGFGQRRFRERSGSGDVYKASIMAPPIDAGHGYGGSCGSIGNGHGGGCDGGGHGA